MGELNPAKIISRNTVIQTVWLQVFSFVFYTSITVTGGQFVKTVLRISTGTLATVHCQPISRILWHTETPRERRPIQHLKW